jgi:predicted HNH restriction endonuclease
MSNALFINGISGDVLAEILEAQKTPAGEESFLQPYKGHIIALLKRDPPTPETPVQLYISTTENLAQICYTAKVVRWEDKRHISDKRRQQVGDYLRKYQPGEANYFREFDRKANKAVNLITIRSLKQLDSLHSTTLLRKVSDGMPLKKRSRAGGWSEVYDIGDLVDLPVETEKQHESELSKGVTESTGLSDAALKKRLTTADKLPRKIQVVSIGYRRNPDVIVAVRRRAKGICERCKKKAPFLRRSDGSPYLESHHWKPLAEGGEDTVENAAALCPNCHRELHHGKSTGEPAGGAYVSPAAGDPSAHP